MKWLLKGRLIESFLLSGGTKAKGAWFKFGSKEILDFVSLRKYFQDTELFPFKVFCGNFFKGK